MPTSSPKACADYVLFAGLKPIAIVEAKRKRINIADRIPQAERYAREYKLTAEQEQPWLYAGQQPWNVQELGDMPLKQKHPFKWRQFKRWSVVSFVQIIRRRSVSSTALSSMKRTDITPWFRK